MCLEAALEKKNTFLLVKLISCGFLKSVDICQHMCYNISSLYMKVKYVYFLYTNCKKQFIIMMSNYSIKGQISSKTTFVINSTEFNRHGNLPDRWSLTKVFSELPCGKCRI